MKASNLTAPYDSVFKTLITDAKELLIPFINEIFKTAYTAEDNILFLDKELIYSDISDRQQKRSVDSSFYISRNNITRHYHLECQSYSDRRILFRMFEYDVQLAIKDIETYDENTLKVTLPTSAVLFLRAPEKLAAEAKIIISSQDESMVHAVTYVNINDYDLDKIIAKKLYFLIPFYIFRYDRIIKKANENDMILQTIKDEYRRIISCLNKAVQTGQIDTHTCNVLLKMTGSVVNSYTIKYNKVRKEIENIMGGYIINYDGRSEWLKTRKEIEDSYEKGVEQGIELGIDKGVAKGRSEERDRILEYLSASGKFTENEIQEFLERFPLAEQN